MKQIPIKQITRSFTAPDAIVPITFYPDQWWWIDTKVAIANWCEGGEVMWN